MNARLTLLSRRCRAGALEKLVLLVTALVLATGAFAAPFELSYGGRLTEASGKPVEGPVNMRVTFFRSLTGSDQVAVAVPDFTGVALQDGVFQIILSLSAADFHTIFNGVDPAYIQVEDLRHGVTYPRQKFSAVPYALKVPVDGKSITFNADGELSLKATGGAAGKFLKFDGPGVLVWDNIPGGGDMLTSNNLSDLPSAATARTNLGLGTAATKNVGTGAGDVAAGNHTHAPADVSGLGGLASKSAVGSSDITDGSVTGTDIADGTITDADINATANISYLKISGLGSAASKNVGTAAGEVAAGSHTHTMSAVSDAGSLATKNAVGSADITDGSIADADVSASAAIAGSKINPNFGAQNMTTTGNVTANGVTASTLQANTDLKLKSDNANTVTMQAPAALGSAYTVTLPADTGSNGQVLTTDGNGVLSWGTVSGGGGGGGDMFKADNLGGLANTATARTNLGLGSLATKSAVSSSDITDGSITETDIASGTITDANISASAAISTSKISGLGGLAAKSAVGSSDITDGSVTGTDIADGTITDADINATANISYLKISGLGSAASKNVGTAAGEVAAGSHTHTMSAVSDAGSLATKNAVGSSDITDGTIVNADINASAAIAGSKINPDFAAQNVTTTGNVTGAILQANSNLKLKSDNANTVTMQSPAGLGAAYTLTLPINDGNNGQVLTTDGNGALSWGTAATGNMLKSENLSGLSDNAAARTNLGLSSLATQSAVGSSDITDGSVTSTDIADGTITDADINATAAISYLKISGLGSAASKNIGTTASDVAAGSHTHTMSAVTDAGSLATKSAVGSSDITDGSIANADINASAAIAGSKISPNFAAQDVTTTGNLSATEVKGTSYIILATTSGQPPATDCDNAAEYGRMKVDTVSGSPSIFICTQDGWSRFFFNADRNVILYTRGTIAANDTLANKDALCASELGPAYVTANIKDINTNPLQNGASSFNTTSSTFSFYYTGTYMDDTTAGTYSLACVLKTAPIRFTRTAIAYNDTLANKDALCVTEFGDRYATADVKEIRLAGMATSSDPLTYTFNTSSATTSFYFTSGGIQTNTGGTRELACHRK